MARPQGLLGPGHGKVDRRRVCRHESDPGLVPPHRVTMLSREIDGKCRLASKLITGTKYSSPHSIVVHQAAKH